MHLDFDKMVKKIEYEVETNGSCLKISKNIK